VDAGALEVGYGGARRAPFEGHDRQAGAQQFLGEDGAGEPHPHDYGVYGSAYGGHVVTSWMGVSVEAGAGRIQHRQGGRSKAAPSAAVRITPATSFVRRSSRHSRSCATVYEACCPARRE
jgi:hypothetical protein